MGKLVYCEHCQKRHRTYSKAWHRCKEANRPYSREWIDKHGIPSKDCNLYANNDKISLVAGHADGYGTTARKGQSLKEFTDDYESFFGVGITVTTSLG